MVHSGGFAQVRGSMVRGSRLVLGSLLVFGSVTAPLRAQDPMAAAPKNYKLEFDNEYVRVIRASLAPRDHIPVHQHPTFPTVYVYLTDAGPTRFTHITPSYTIERAPVRAGGVRYNRNPHEETHVVDNLSDLASEYLRIEMKTTPDTPHRDFRMLPEDNGPVEDVQVRISRHRCAPGKVCDMPTGPAVVVLFNDRSVSWTGPGVVSLTHNYSEQPLHELWIELRTKPIK